MVFGVSQNVFSNSVLLMFGAWQMEIPPGYNFLLFPIDPIDHVKEIFTCIIKKKNLSMVYRFTLLMVGVF